ncbi:MAG TPA: hypothetical protein VGL28_03690 [Steroidobacteraceae bacterium]
MAAVAGPSWPASDALADGMRHCTAETDQARRLVCFDALAATLPKFEADRFGLTADIARKRDPESERRTEEAVLPGKIAALGQGPRGEYIFTLDNQQVWAQVEVEPTKKFAVGEVVHIEHGAMGSLWLAAGKGRMTKVKRIS